MGVTNKTKHTWTLLLLSTNHYTSTQTHFYYTPAPPLPHPAEPGCPVGLGSSSVSDPCWLNVSFV